MREQRHILQTADTICGQYDRSIERPIISGKILIAPALALESILPPLADFAFMTDITESHSNIPVSINALVRAFECSRSSIQPALTHRLDELGHRGKHTGIDRDRELQILDWDRQNAQQNIVIRKGEIIDYCATQFWIRLTRGLVNSFGADHSGQVIQPTSNPSDEQRLQEPRVLLERTIRDLKENVRGCAAKQVFNLDEVSILDWEDCTTKKVVVRH
jgi:hypothetical protein